MSNTTNTAQEWEWLDNSKIEQSKTNLPLCSLQSTAPGTAFSQCTSSFEDCFKCPLNRNKRQ